MSEQRRDEPSTTTRGGAAGQRTQVGGGKADGSPRATSHQGQPAQAGEPAEATRPGGSNTPGGAMKTGPDASGSGAGSNQ